MNSKLKHNKTKYILIFNLALCLFIVVWGAWVRLSGSGAGCGDHWPLCNGEVVPLSATWKTYTEYLHRFSTGLFGLTVLAQILFSHLEYGKSHRVTKGSYALLIMTLIESFIGAVLVKKGLVVDNTSAARAWVVGGHLVNTLLLLFCFPYSYSFLEDRESHMKKIPWRESKKESLLGGIGLGLILLVGAFGAITALGNTLFPSESLGAGFAADFNESSPFLIKLRIYHPILAIFMGAYWIVISTQWSDDRSIAKYCQSVYTIVFVAIGFGLINWLLMAPVWGALVHLLLADILWLAVSMLLLRKLHK